MKKQLDYPGMPGFTAQETKAELRCHDQGTEDDLAGVGCPAMMGQADIALRYLVH